MATNWEKASQAEKRRIRRAIAEDLARRRESLAKAEQTRMRYRVHSAEGYDPFKDEAGGSR